LVILLVKMTVMCGWEKKTKTQDWEENSDTLRVSEGSHDTGSVRKPQPHSGKASSEFQALSDCQCLMPVEIAGPPFRRSFVDSLGDASERE
jgi:hypothetical protein